MLFVGRQPRGLFITAAKYEKKMRIGGIHGCRLVELGNGFGPLPEFAESQGRGEVAAFLRWTTGWEELCFAHEVEAVLGAETAVAWVRAMLRAGARVASPATIAVGRESAASRLVLRGAEAWSIETRELFPAADRAEAARLLRVASLLSARMSLPQELALWLLPLLVARSEI